MAEIKLNSTTDYSRKLVKSADFIAIGPEEIDPYMFVPPIEDDKLNGFVVVRYVLTLEFV